MRDSVVLTACSTIQGGTKPCPLFDIHFGTLSPRGRTPRLCLTTYIMPLIPLLTIADKYFKKYYFLISGLSLRR